MHYQPPPQTPSPPTAREMPPKPRKGRPEQGSDEAKEQMRRVRAAQMHNFLSNHPVEGLRDAYEQRRVSFDGGA